MNGPVEGNLVTSIAAIVPTIEEHHPRLTALRVFGLEKSEALDDSLRSLGYEYKAESEMEGLLYARPMGSLKTIPEIVLDAIVWKTTEDVYDAFFAAVGAPDWHGRNFDALIDSIESGAINRIEVPYRIVVRNAYRAKNEAALVLSKFTDLIHEICERGCPVDIRID